MRWVMLLCLLLAGCTGPYTTRYVKLTPVQKAPLYANSSRWVVLFDNDETVEMWYDDAIRVVPGVPISVCETVDSNGNVVKRELARRKD